MRTRPVGVASLAGRAAAGLAVLAGLAGPTGVAAQDAAPRVITFPEAVRIALDENTDLLRVRAEAELRDVVESRERMDFLPELSLSTRGTRSFGRSFSQEEGTILSETSDFFDAGLSASINVFDGMEKFASLRRASLEYDASRLRLDRTREDIVFRVVEGFTTLTLASELVRVREEELAAAAELLEQVRQLVDLGRQPLSDLYQQQAAHAEAEAALVEATRQVELTETGLMQTLELDPLGSYAFRVPDLPDDADFAPADYDLEQLIAAAFARRADLAALEAGVAAAGEGVTAARSGYWPSLDLSFDYGSNWSGNSLQPIPGTGTPPDSATFTTADGDAVTFELPGSGADPDFRRPDFVEQLDARRGGNLSLSLSMPVFNRLQTRTAVAQAEVQRTNALYDLQDQRQQVALQVRQALLDFRSALAQREATARRLDAANRAWEAATRRYELGAATFVEVTQARSTLVSARSAHLRARFSVLLADRRIHYHTGSLDPEDSLLQDTGEDADDS